MIGRSQKGKGTVATDAQSNLGGLMEGLDTPPAISTATVKNPGMLARWRARWAVIQRDPARASKVNTRLAAGGVLIALTTGLAMYFVFRPMPKPDYDKDRLDNVFRYTLLTEQFNNLSIEERMKLIGQLVGRLKSMSSGDSMLMASFAAGIAGSARQQIERNASRLAIDSWDKYARGYADIPEGEKGEYLDKTLIEFSKMMEALGGRARDISDEERLSEVKREIAREKDRISKPGNKPGATDVGRMFTFVDRNIGTHAGPAQKARAALLMRDLGRHLRKEDIATGKPGGG